MNEICACHDSEEKPKLVQAVSSEVLLAVRNLYFSYGEQTVLKDVSLDIFKNDFLGIIGPNGGGKTTLLKLMLGLLSPRSGTIDYLQGSTRSSIGYLPQINQIDKKFPILVKEVIESGLAKPGKHKEEAIAFVAERMGLHDLLRKPIGQLSGGQLQRVLLARALVSRPKLLILDEPSSYVDKRFESKFYDVLAEINTDTAVILVSHDVGTVLSMVKNIACVNESLHYHAGRDVKVEWLDAHFSCPVDLVGHGDFPHRVLKSHS